MEKPRAVLGASCSELGEQGRREQAGTAPGVARPVRWSQVLQVVGASHGAGHDVVDGRAAAVASQLEVDRDQAQVAQRAVGLKHEGEQALSPTPSPRLHASPLHREHQSPRPRRHSHPDALASVRALRTLLVWRVGRVERQPSQTMTTRVVWLMA